MRGGRVLLLIYLLAGVSTVAGADPRPVEEVAPELGRFVNTQISVEGRLRSPVDSSRRRFRWEFLLTGDRGASVRVITANKLIPRVGESHSVTGLVRADESGIYLEEAAAGGWNPLVLGLAAVLGLGAILLAVQLLRSRAVPAASTDDGFAFDGRGGRGAPQDSAIPTIPEPRCPTCQRPLAPGERFCRFCPPPVATGAPEVIAMGVGDVGTSRAEGTRVADPAAGETELRNVIGNLYVRAGPLKGRLVPIFGNPVTIGRAHGQSLQLQDRDVSREHAVIRLEDGTLYFEDLGSGNGSWVNEARVTRHPLEHNDEIRIGDSVFKFEKRE